MFLNQAHAGCKPMHAWLLKSFYIQTLVYMSVCPFPRALITSHVKGTLNSQIMEFYGFSISLYDTTVDKLNGHGLSNTAYCERLPKKTKVTRYWL